MSPMLTGVAGEAILDRRLWLVCSCQGRLQELLESSKLESLKRLSLMLMLRLCRLARWKRRKDQGTKKTRNVSEKLRMCWCTGLL